ncbi:MAG: aldose 1-epimerase [Acidobacteria bacterium]|nr:aldose 1-epimerase [Acidobacteriota bacterium]
MEAFVRQTRREWMAVAGVGAMAGCSLSEPPPFQVIDSDVALGGQKAVILKRSGVSEPLTLTEAEILPGRGFNTWQLRGIVAGKGVTDLFTAPSLAEAAKLMTLGENDYRGNESFKNGGSPLVPFANRIRGKLDEKARTIETSVGGNTVKLPANWEGKNPGAEPHSMHGLILGEPLKVTTRDTTSRAYIEATYEKTFAGEWPGQMAVRCSAELDASSFALTITAKNTGSEPLPMGLGWHPYFNIPSGDRTQAKLRIPAKTRALVDNYDNVFPTGEIEPTEGSKFDFREARTMGDQFLDDCFFDLIRAADGTVTAEIHDPKSGFKYVVTSKSKDIKAYQCYAPPDKSFIVLEPQYNIGDPFNTKIWRDRDTGIVMLAPGQETTYDATVRLVKI